MSTTIHVEGDPRRILSTEKYIQLVRENLFAAKHYKGSIKHQKERGEKVRQWIVGLLVVFVLLPIGLYLSELTIIAYLSAMLLPIAIVYLLLDYSGRIPGLNVFRYTRSLDAYREGKLRVCEAINHYYVLLHHTVSIGSTGYQSVGFAIDIPDITDDDATCTLSYLVFYQCEVDDTISETHKIPLYGIVDFETDYTDQVVLSMRAGHQWPIVMGTMYPEYAHDDCETIVELVGLAAELNEQLSGIIYMSLWKSIDFFLCLLNSNYIIDNILLMRIFFLLGLGWQSVNQSLTVKNNVIW